ncbi:MAG TPA: glycosyltransferase [Vicinamibacterales bacterium]|jgi:hypothetical protein|nr:glycosyltransferase [Vicinamibacterales bacterium]
MKISLYTAVKDAIYYDLHAAAMLKHHLPLADEIIVNEGYSTDDTLKVVSNIDPKIKVFQTVWEKPTGPQWGVAFKDEARRRCTGDWCIVLDADEFIPEWEFEAIRRHLERTDRTMISTQFVNFYANYRVYYKYPERIRWPFRKMNIHRNLPDIEFWGDGSNVKLRDQPFSWDASDTDFTVHHFGAVRSPSRLRQKWSFQGRAVTGRKKWLRPPAWLFKLFPHQWVDAQFMDGLALYDGEPVAAVRSDPGEFVRDGFKVMKMFDA